jgi:hypothetical protein
MTSSSGSKSGGSDPKEALERSQEAIDEAKDAARNALRDSYPGSDMDAPGTGEGLEANEKEVAPRPN